MLLIFVHVIDLCACNKQSCPSEYRTRHELRQSKIRSVLLTFDTRRLTTNGRITFSWSISIVFPYYSMVRFRCTISQRLDRSIPTRYGKRPARCTGCKSVRQQAKGPFQMRKEAYHFSSFPSTIAERKDIFSKITSTKIKQLFTSPLNHKSIGVATGFQHSPAPKTARTSLDAGCIYPQYAGREKIVIISFERPITSNMSAQDRHKVLFSFCN